MCRAQFRKTDKIKKVGFKNANLTITPFYSIDSAYTERYMGFPRPDGNWKGYDLSDLSAKASQFHGKNFFLIHGTADDNVHFQQSMVLTRALVDQNILFRLQVRDIHLVGQARATL